MSISPIVHVKKPRRSPLRLRFLTYTLEEISCAICISYFSTAPYEEIIMEKLKPKLFSVMKTYTKQQFVKDVIAGIIVAIIALPLSIALALASGVGPEQGIYTAIIAGFLISFFGGSRVQIAGPTAAFATIVARIVARINPSIPFCATIPATIVANAAVGPAICTRLPPKNDIRNPAMIAV